MMIITCNNCEKKFDVDSNLIPKIGRLLECNSCNHRWFFKKNMTTVIAPSIEIKSPVDVDIESTRIDNTTIEKKSIEIKSPESIDLLEDSDNSASITSNNIINREIINDKYQEKKIKKNYNILALTIIFIISFIALIIIIDTFKNPISKIFPNVELFLYNLYESIKDVILFFKDLI